mgnify:CR=1 FL=1
MKTNILIVDDNTNLLKSMKHILSKKTYKIFEASTAKEAFDLIDQFHIDIIILDINLPDLSGIDMCKNIKSRINNNILILLISSENISSEEQSIGFEAGADGYIIRPISNREFLARVESIIRIKKSEDNLRESNKLNEAYTKEIELTLNTLNKIMDYSLDIICTAKDGKFLTINNACEKILGYQPEELINKFCDNFLHPDDLQKTLNARTQINEGCIINHFENRYIHKNGKIVHLMWSSHSPDKEKIVFCVARDITEKKLMEEQVLKNQKLESLGTFVSGIIKLH